MKKQIKKHTKKKTLIQWHSAFRGAIKVELSNEAIPLMYREEHPVAKKPLNIDLLIIQKTKNKLLKNAIGHIFKTFNILEYKGPDDSLSVNDFYKVYAYACIFKSDSPETLLFSNKQTKKECVKQMNLSSAADSSATTEIFPIQVIVVRDLDLCEHTWLKALSKKIDPIVFDYIMTDYQTGKGNDNKDVVIDAVIKGNPNIIDKWKEGRNMSGALLELFRPELEDLAQDMAQGMAQDIAQGMAQDIAQDIANEKSKIIIYNMLKKEMSYEDIAEITSLDVDTIKKYEQERLNSKTD